METGEITDLKLDSDWLKVAGGKKSRPTRSET